MADLSFNIYSNSAELTRLRTEIALLEQRLKSFSPGASVSTIRSIELQLQSARSRFNDLSMAAASAGAAMELNLRRGVNGAIAAIDSLQGKLSNPITGLTEAAGVAALGAFLSKVTSIRGQFQEMESSIRVLVGENVGKKLIGELNQLAKVSPLDFKGTVGGAQMMLGFGIEAEKVPRYLSAISDVSMGNAQRFQSLNLAFSQMSAAGKLMGQDLNQMINAGFNPLQTMADKTGKSIAALKKEMSDGKISAAMVQQAFIDATSEGGKYYGMAEQGAKTINGQMSMLEDATTLMFNDLGQGCEDLVMKAIKGATFLVENWQTVGRVLVGALATFGVYKASKMAMDYAEKVSTEEKTQAVVDGFTKQIEAMKAYEAAKAGNQAKELVEPEAVQKMKAGETLDDTELEQIRNYTSELAALQQKKEAHDAVTKSIQAELDKLRELNAEENGGQAVDAPKFDADLQSIIDEGSAPQEMVAALQEQRDLMREKQSLAEKEYDDAMRNLDAASAQVEVAKKRVSAADELVAKLQEEYDTLLAEDDAESAPLEDYGISIKSWETLLKAEELERAEKDASTRASELLEAQNNEESASRQLQSAAAERNTITERANAVSHQQNSAAIAGNTGATNANTGATNTNTVAVTRATIASKFHAAGTKLAGAAHHFLNGAVNAGTKALEGLKLAWATNPFGLVLTIVSTLGTMIWSLVGGMNDAEEKTKKFADEAAKSVDDINMMYNVLAATDEQSQIHKKTLEDLVRTMKEHGIKIDDEADKLAAVNKHRERLIELIMEEGRQRDIANNIADIQESTKDAKEGFRKGIKASFKGSDAAKYGDTLAKVLEEDVEKNAERLKVLQDKLHDFQGRESAAKVGGGKALTAAEKAEFEATIKEYEQLAYGRFNELASKYDVKKLTLERGRINTDSKFSKVSGLVNATAKRNEEMALYTEAQKSSQQKIDSAKTKEVFDPTGKDFDAINKDITDTDAKIAEINAKLAELKGKKAKVNIDKTDADEASKATSKATKNVEEHDKVTAKTKIDSSEAGVAKEATDKAAKAVDELDKKSATANVDSSEVDLATVKLWEMNSAADKINENVIKPEVDMTFLEAAWESLKEFWDSLVHPLGGKQKKGYKPISDQQFADALNFNGKDNVGDAFNVNIANSAQEEEASRLEREKAELEAQRKRDMDAKFDKAKNAKTNKDASEAKKELNTMLEKAEWGSAEYNRIQKAISDLDKRQKNANPETIKKEAEARDQRLYNKKKAQEAEDKRLAEQALARANELEEQRISQIKNAGEKERATIKHEADKKRQALDKEVQREADVLEKNDMQEWINSGKDRSEAKYYKQFSNDKLKQMRQGYTDAAKKNIGYDVKSATIDYESFDRSKKFLDSEVKAYRDYLKEYGDLTERFDAARSERDAKVAEAREKGDKTAEAAAMAQYDRDVQKLTSEKLEQDTGLDKLYFGLESYTSEFLTTLKDRIKGVLENPNLNIEIQDRIRFIDKLDEINNALTVKVNKEAKGFIAQMAEGGQGLWSVFKALKEAKDANKRQRDAEETNQMREDAQKSGQNAKRPSASDYISQVNGVEIPSRQHNNGGTNIPAQIEAANKAGGAKGWVQQLKAKFGWGGSASGAPASGGQGGGVLDSAGASEGASGGGAPAFAITDAIIHGVNANMQSMVELMDEFDIADTTFGEGMTKFAESSQYATQAFDSLKSGDFVGVVTNLNKAFRTLGESLKSWGLDSDLFGMSDRTIEKDIAKLSEAVEGLKLAMEILAKKWENASVGKASGLFKEEYSQTKAIIDRYQNNMSRAVVAYDNGFMGIGGKSSGRKMLSDKLGKDSDATAIFRELSKLTGKNVGEHNFVETFFGMTPEQMADFAAAMPDAFKKIMDYSDKGAVAVSELCNQYIQYADQLKEIENKLRESITNTSFDSVLGDFKSALLKMESAMQDFGDNFETMMRNAVVNALVNGTYKERLESWYKNFASHMESGNMLDANEIIALRQEWKGLTSEANQRRKELFAAIGIDGATASQQASTRSIANMSQDTGDAIAGRMTAIQIAVETIRAGEERRIGSLADIDDKLLQVAMVNTEMNVTQRNIEAQLARMHTELQCINENTGAIIKPIQAMQLDIAQIKSNTNRL